MIAVVWESRWRKRPDDQSVWFILYIAVCLSWSWQCHKCNSWLALYKIQIWRKHKKNSETYWCVLKGPFEWDWTMLSETKIPWYWRILPSTKSYQRCLCGWKGIASRNAVFNFLGVVTEDEACGLNEFSNDQCTICNKASLFGSKWMWQMAAMFFPRDMDFC